MEEEMINKVEPLLEIIPQTSQEIPLIQEPPKPKAWATPELVMEWKAWYLREGHTFHSTTTYYNYIKMFVGYGVEINQASVNRFRNRHMCFAASGAVKKFFEFLVHKKDFPHEILYLHFDRSKSIKKLPKTISPMEVQLIIDAMPTLFYKNLTLAVYELGLRVSEVMKLRWEDFNWLQWLQDKTKDGTVSLINTKGQNFRIIPAPRVLMEKLYNEHQNKNSMGIPIGKTTSLVFDLGLMEYMDKTKSKEENMYDYIVIHASDTFRKKLEKISISVLNKKVNPHCLRHTKANDMLEHGVPLEVIKEYLGHARISTTEIYAKASTARIRNVMSDYYRKKEEEHESSNLQTMQEV